MKKIWLGIVAIVVLFIAIELNAQEEATNVVYVDVTGLDYQMEQ